MCHTLGSWSYSADFGTTYPAACSTRKSYCVRWLEGISQSVQAAEWHLPTFGCGPRTTFRRPGLSGSTHEQHRELMDACKAQATSTVWDLQTTIPILPTRIWVPVTGQRWWHFLSLSDCVGWELRLISTFLHGNDWTFHNMTCSVFLCSSYYIK